MNNNKVSLKNEFMRLLENHSTKLNQIKKTLNLICEKFNISPKDFLNDAYTVGKVGFNPLQTAIMMGKPDVVKYLLQQGASLNEDNGNSPLYLAAQSGQRKIFRILREAGAPLDNTGVVQRMNAAIFKKNYGNSILRHSVGLNRPTHNHIIGFVKGNKKAKHITKYVPPKEKVLVDEHWNSNSYNSNYNVHNPWGLNNTTRQNSIARTMTYMTKPNNNNKGIPEEIRTKGRKRQQVFNQKNLRNRIGSFLVKNNNMFNKGGSQFIHIPNYGKRKVRYQKNGRAYVIVNKKKLKL